MCVPWGDFGFRSSSSLFGTSTFEFRILLENNHGVPDTDKVFQSNDVPVGNAYATVTRRAANGFRIVGAVNSDSWFVEAHPNHTDQVVRARWQIIILVAANPIVEHRFVVAKPGPGRGADYLPGSDRRRQRSG